MNKLPNWCLTNKHPSVYDTESATVIEQTAKVYGAMNELIEKHNEFVAETTEKINEFEADVIQSQVEFEVSMRQVLQDHADTVEIKTKELEKKIEESGSGSGGALYEHNLTISGASTTSTGESGNLLAYLNILSPSAEALNIEGIKNTLMKKDGTINIACGGSVTISSQSKTHLVTSIGIMKMSAMSLSTFNAQAYDGSSFISMPIEDTFNVLDSVRQIF